MSHSAGLLCFVVVVVPLFVRSGDSVGWQVLEAARSLRTSIHICLSICTCVFTYTYVCICIYTHTQRGRWIGR